LVPLFLGYCAYGQAAGRLFGIHQIPGLDQVSFPHFPKIGRLAAPVGYICWDFLFYVVVGLPGWTIWQDPFDDFYKSSLVLLSKVDTGYPLSPWLDNDKGSLATSVMPLRAALLQCEERREQEVEEEEREAALLSKSRLWRGIDGGRICDLCLCERRTLLALDAKSNVVYRLISYTSDWR
jgi:hypothetical protein